MVVLNNIRSEQGVIVRSVVDFRLPQWLNIVPAFKAAFGKILSKKSLSLIDLDERVVLDGITIK